MSDHLGVNILAVLYGLGGAAYLAMGLLFGLNIGLLAVGVVVLLLAVGLWAENKIAWWIAFIIFLLSTVGAVIGLLASAVLGSLLALMGLGILAGIGIVAVAIIDLVISGGITYYLWTVRDDF